MNDFEFPILDQIAEQYPNLSPQEEKTLLSKFCELRDKDIKSDQDKKDLFLKSKPKIFIRANFWP